HGIKVGDTLYVAGQVALDEELRIVGPGDPEAQERQTWRNIQKVVEAAGGEGTDVVKVTTFLARIEDAAPVQAVQREVLPHGDYPIATMVEAAKLGLPGLLLETEAIAIIGLT